MASDRIPEGKYIVPALAQGLAVLGLFSRERPTLTAPDIALELGLSRTTVFRLLHTLQTMGYVTKAEEERRYKLGAALLGRGFSYLSSLDIVEVAQPILEQLRDETGMSTHMAVRDGRDVVYVARYAARTTVASSVHIGTRFPVHATVMGRMTICDFTAEELAALYPDEALPRFSEQTPATRSALAAVLAEDRARGYAVSQSFFERGVSSVAAPVRDGSGRIVAAINATSVDSVIDPSLMHGHVKDAVIGASTEITKWMSQGSPGRPKVWEAEAESSPPRRVAARAS